jgi:hypothetical protein
VNRSGVIETTGPMIEDSDTELDDPADAVEFIEPPNPIKAKISGRADIDPAALAKAEAVIAALGRDYPDRALPHVERMQERVDRACLDPLAGADCMDAIYRIAHDMRGQGCTFGYPLVSRIGTSLCRLTERPGTVDDAVLEAVAAHVGALKAVLTERIEGDGGDADRQLARDLELLADRHGGRA